MLPISEHIALQYSHEGRDFGSALETAGGIVRALPRLVESFRDETGRPRQRTISTLGRLDDSGG